MTRRRLARLLGAGGVVITLVAVAPAPTLAVDYQLEVVAGTFTTRVNEQLTFTVSTPTNAAIEAMLIDRATTAVVQMSNPLVTRQAVAAIVEGGTFVAEAESAIPGPIFRPVTPAAVPGYQVLIATSVAARRDGSLLISRDGLRAVRLTLTAPSGLISQLTSFINVVSSRTTTPLPVTMIATIDGAPTLQPDGSIVVGAAEREKLRDLRDLLFRKPPGVPLGIRVRPELLNGLARSTDEADQSLFAELAKRLPDNDVLVSTFRPIDVASYAAAGLKSQFEAQLLRGETILDALNGPNLPLRAAWVSNDAIDATGVDFLRTFGVTNVVVVGDGVKTYGADTNPNRPYALRSATTGVVLNLADTRYANLLDEPTGTAYASATAIAAEIIAQRNELAGSPVGSTALATRQLVLASTSGVPTEPLIAAIVLRHLRGAPQVKLRRVSEFAPTLEGLARIGPPVVPLIDISTIQTRTNDALGSIDVVRDVLATNEGLTDRWVELVDVANDTTLTEVQRTTYLDAVLNQVNAARTAVKLPTRSFTFGSRDSELRLALINSSVYAVSLQLRVTSPNGKMSFVPTEFAVVIPPGDQRELVMAARARANGLIPIELVLSSPNGMVLDVAQIRVRVNAIAGLGRGVSAVFIVLLGAWWLIHARRSHKQKTAEKHPVLRSPV